MRNLITAAILAATYITFRAKGQVEKSRNQAVRSASAAAASASLAAMQAATVNGLILSGRNHTEGAIKNAEAAHEAALEAMEACTEAQDCDDDEGGVAHV